MLKNFLILLGVVFFISCGGGSSKEGKELLSKILQFVGIPHSIIVNVCQDSNRDGVCGGKELFTKLIIEKGDLADEIFRKIVLTDDGRYFLKNVDPNLPILVEFEDETNIDFDEGKFTFIFKAFENEEQNEVKEISILEAIVDADAITKDIADKFRTLKSVKAQDNYYIYLLKALETNINTLRSNGFDKQRAMSSTLKEMGEELISNQIEADKINDCENNQTCQNKEIEKLYNELIIDDDEVIEIRGKSKSNAESTDTSIKGEEVQYGKWVKPSKSICEDNGGLYNQYEDNDCDANWKNANKICNATGGNLPDIDTLRAVITDCGGALYRWNEDNSDSNADKNINNKSYQSCYKEKGFTSDFYLSSTIYSSDSSNIWYIYLYDGYDYWNDKTEISRVRCVR